MRVLCPACEGAKRIKKPENLDLTGAFSWDKRETQWQAEGFIKCPCCKGKGTQNIQEPQYQHPAPMPPLGLDQQYLHDFSPRLSMSLVARTACCLILFFALTTAASAQQPAQAPPQILPGTVLVSRWYDESLNTSPGWLNHLAIYAGNGEVIESQADRGVIKTPLAEYLARAQQVTKLLPRTAEIGAAAAERARSFVGRSYGRFASIDPLWRFRRHNCVSVIEQAYRPESGFVWGIRRPDHVFKLVK